VTVKGNVALQRWNMSALFAADLRKTGREDYTSTV
jgi:hypothetical protein